MAVFWSLPLVVVAAAAVVFIFICCRIRRHYHARVKVHHKVLHVSLERSMMMRALHVAAFPAACFAVIAVPQNATKRRRRSDFNLGRCHFGLFVSLLVFFFFFVSVCSNL